ncbi:hypothetical protein BaRGS_00034822 [Batillaria attramentaria]|uniref:Uncharacterized protein n=1 Tax=Batillaria attramentaria TaxID=370345 RepID=A0ABD0JG50_9CAEN
MRQIDGNSLNAPRRLSSSPAPPDNADDTAAKDEKEIHLGKRQGTLYAGAAQVSNPTLGQLTDTLPAQLKRLPKAPTHILVPMSDDRG